MIDPVMRVGREQKVDFLVAGSGIAGLRAALELAARGSVLILTKDDPSESITRYASGGIFIPQADDESVGVHVQETVRHGDGLCREDVVRALADEGPREIRQLCEWGARFEERNHAAPLLAGGTARRSGLLRPAGGSTGMEILSALTTKARTLSSLRTKAGSIVLNLLVEDGTVLGATYLDEANGSLRTVRCNALLLATGGLGQVYAETTNPPGACGDGVALAFRAGALLSDMEFVQFHPTVLCAKAEPRLMLSVALREKGAHLRNLELERFMLHYHEAGDLAPADVVSRAILCEMEKKRSGFVYLDLTGLDPGHVKRRFPQIYAACMENNIDITSDLVPTRPAAHFAMGGVAANIDGSTSLRGLYAAGEVACTGLHGANRLANNSLLECLVYGVRAAHAMEADGAAASFPAPPAAQAAAPQCAPPPTGVASLDAVAAKREIRRLMWESAGVIRHGSKLKEAAKRLNALALPQPDDPARSSVEIESLLQAARLIIHCAEARKESRGAHYRTDYPLRNDSETPKHSFVSKNCSVYFK
ncbi:MAG: L-aspartate oxidase [Terriglobia bacterium]